MNKFNKKMWHELKTALGLKEKNIKYTKDIKVLFYKDLNHKNSIAIVTEGIDNLFDKKTDSRWDIVLFSDGTWIIN